MARGLANAQPPCSAKFANAPPPAQAELTDAAQKRQTGSIFKLSIHEWNLDLPGMTVIPPLET